ELPFHLTTVSGPIDGIIDLLYQDERGQWHLLDWKSDQLRGDDLAKAARPYLGQLALYRWAATQLLGQTVSAGICFLQRPETVYQPPDDLLQLPAGIRVTDAGA
ncbi:MAG: PD-(D/E)XK nuclease family protein, partial [Anaerolineales bacterium]|nr:PD-(D/E)XK nuclease family protein [Anaerolineales bacterium]